MHVHNRVTEYDIHSLACRVPYQHKVSCQVQVIGAVSEYNITLPGNNKNALARCRGMR